MRPSNKRARRRSSSFSALFIPAAFFIGLAAGYMLGSSRGTSATARLDPATEDDPSLGPKNAAVTIVEFSDYQCPYCQMWHNDVLPSILANYPDDVRFIYRDFPLGGHTEARPAAEAANCAGEQEAYWEFQGAIFGNQYGYGRSAYEQVADDLGLDTQEFVECIDSGIFTSEVLEDYNDGLKLGVQSTPTFFINGTQLVGAQPYENFQQLIEAEIAKAGQ